MTLRLVKQETEDWCEVDHCPISICAGPHRSHEHHGYVFTVRVGNTCPFCDRVVE